MKKRIFKLTIVVLIILTVVDYNVGSTKYRETSIVFHPDTYDLNKAKKQGLVGVRLNDLSEYYVELQTVYRIVLEDKLKEELSLIEFNEDIHTLDKYYSPYTGEPEYNEGYQALTTMDLDYLFLRNNIHIENLNDADLELLKSKVDIEDPLNDKELIDLINRTFLDVLKIRVYGRSGEVEEGQTISYNSYWSSCCALKPHLNADVDAIIIEVRAENNYIDGNSIEGYDIAHEELIQKLLQFESDANQVYKVSIMYYGYELDDYKIDE